MKRLHVNSRRALALVSVGAILATSLVLAGPAQAHGRDHHHRDARVVVIAKRHNPVLVRHVHVRHAPRIVYATRRPAVVVPVPIVVPAPEPIIVAAASEAPPLSATPVSAPYQAANGLVCREYQATAEIGGVPQSTYGTACLQPDGAWRIVD